MRAEKSIRIYATKSRPNLAYSTREKKGKSPLSPRASRCKIVKRWGQLIYAFFAVLQLSRIIWQGQNKLLPLAEQSRNKTFAKTSLTFPLLEAALSYQICIKSSDWGQQTVFVCKNCRNGLLFLWAMWPCIFDFYCWLEPIFQVPTPSVDQLFLLKLCKSWKGSLSLSARCCCPFSFTLSS